MCGIERGQTLRRHGGHSLQPCPLSCNWCPVHWMPARLFLRRCDLKAVWGTVARTATRCYSHSRRHGENRTERDHLPVATKCSESMSDSSVCGYAALRRLRDTWDWAPCPAWGASVTAGVALRYSESVHTTQRPMTSTAGLRPAPARGVCSRGAERSRAAYLWCC